MEVILEIHHDPDDAMLLTVNNGVPLKRSELADLFRNRTSSIPLISPSRESESFCAVSGSITFKYNAGQLELFQNDQFRFALLEHYQDNYGYTLWKIYIKFTGNKLTFYTEYLPFNL